jgi:hypothetical protein
VPLSTWSCRPPRSTCPAPAKPSFEIDNALRTGASWPQVAAALGTDEAAARVAYREWADGQHDLLTWTAGRIGMSDAEHAAAIDRAAGPDREAGQ